jgi:hypothetical protein
MKKSETITKIAPALLKAQSEMHNAIKDSSNPFFKSKYADLNSVREACIPALNKYGITVLQPTIYEDGKPFVETLLLHESGEYIASLTEIISDKANNAQSHGSGVTYARRYGLQSMCNIGSEDDDGNAASGNNVQPKKEEPKKEVKAKPFLLKDSDEYTKAVEYVSTGGSVAEIKKKYQLLEPTEKELLTYENK